MQEQKYEHPDAIKKENQLKELVHKKKVLAELADLNYRNAVEKAVIKKESEILKPLLLEPAASGFKKVILTVKMVFEVIHSKFVKKELTEVPAYDTMRYGDIVGFAPPKDFDVVEQTWISKPYTMVTILYNKQTHKNIYYISEPELNSFEESLLQRVNNTLKVFLVEQEIDFSHMNKEIVLYNNFIKILSIYGIDLDPRSQYKIWYHIKRDYVGYGKLDTLLKDPMIEDISCVGADTAVYLYHRKYTNIETNTVFEEEELNEMIMKLAQISGKSISVGYPIMNARLPEGSRLEATLGREVTTRGGTITIRKFREEPFTPTDLIKYGTFNKEIMAYFWLAVENNKSIIFVGETASGKTTTLNVISLFIPSESKVISIEDTREITLYHKNWIPGVVREAFTGQEAATIDMFELLRSALRQRPEYLIVGEVRGKEAYTLFQAMSTGHTTFSTMHAGSVQLAVNRLLNEPINVPLMMLNALDIMVIQVLRYVGQKRLRRMEVLSEFVGVDATTGNISTRELYVWNPLQDKMEQTGSSKVLEDITNARGWSREQLRKEIDNRETVLQYMIDNNMSDYRDVSLIIRMYASDPANVLELIKQGKSILSESKWA
ncbi:MAG: type II/IV secretion system ATPase subunit [Candidatus Methanoperedens sp.]|nr:type II/IV secretion system ATPase subunit [Candidatus Methanoperedens sp.]